MRRFHAEFAVTASTRVLDVGGTSLNWSLAPVRPRLVVLNLPRTRQETDAGSTLVFGDGCALPFRDAAFDIVFSNSVIEHLGSEENQQRFAAEVRRVGKRYWVQTPNRWFPVEVHLLMPFLHWLPRSWQSAVARRFTVWQWIERPSPDRRDYYVNHYLESVRLLDETALRGLFPGSAVVKERFLGLVKSLVASRR